MEYQNTKAFAASLDAQDPLKNFRDKFYIPLVNGHDAIYFTGNSLGLQPKTTQDFVLNELEDWANYGVEGHHHSRNPWLSYHEIFPDLLTDIVGGKAEEIVVMNQLTVNLHLLLTTFYRPDKKRYKILCEGKAFPSDQYAIASHVALHGLNIDDALIEVMPTGNKLTADTNDILAAVEMHKEELAVVIIGGVNYYSGYVFDMEKITAATHDAGAYCGFDLAHGAGNIELHLHEWNVDFACWCSYKYLNSGPGGVAGAYVHERHHNNKELLRLAGWWGHDKDTRFKMDKNFVPIPTAEGWQLSNAPVLSMAAHRASLEVFKEAGMKNILSKGKLLSEYLIFVLDDINARADKNVMEIITSKNTQEHGCQVSILMLENGKAIFETLKKNGVIADWREPNVIRVAPVPLYNTFEDIYKFGEIIWQVVHENHHKV